MTETHPPSGSERIAFHAYVSGLVQGVGFRFFARAEAQARGISGTVRNLPDGRVEVAGEGSRTAVESFLEDLRRGPALSGVEAVEVTTAPAKGRTDGFRIGF